MTESGVILVVDDTPELLSFLAGSLRAAGYTVRPAGSGEKALAEAAASPPDLILLDIRMKGMDGLEVCRRIKAREESRNIPVILMSAFADLDEWVDGFKLGAADYINKPFRAAELHARVRTHLSLSRAIHSLEEQAETLGRANARLQGEVVARERVEEELRRSLDRTERSRRALLSALEDQRRSYGEFRASEMRYRRLFESAKEGILILDAHTGRVVDVNPCLLELLGQTHEEVLGHCIWEIPALRAIATSKEAFQKLREKRYLRYDGLPLETGDGRRIAVEFVSNEYSVGMVKVIQCSIRDITERKRAEGELRQANAFLDSIIENIPNMVFLKDARDLRYVRFNHAGEELLGRSRGEVLGKNNRDLWPAPLADYYEAKDREVLRQLDVVDIPEEPIQTKDRGERVLHTKKVPLFDPEGEPEYLLGISEDITESKRSADAIRNLSSRLEAILSAVPEILMEVDNDKVYTWANETGKKFFGADVLGKRAADFFVGEQDTYEVVRPIFEGSQDAVYTESLQRRRDGEARLLAWWCRSLTDSQGNVKGALSSGRDITEIRRAEAERRRLEEQLQVSQKMEAIGSLAGGVAHDFNNLLCVLLSYTEFALRAVRQGDPMREDLLAVKRAGERAATLTRQLLAFSRKQVLQPVPLILNDVASAMERMLRRILGEDIDYVQALAPDLGVVRADQGQIEQVFMNLVVNARDAMPEGGQLTIATSNVEIDEDFAEFEEPVRMGPYVQLAVTDTGSGIDEQTKARIFEPFFTTKEKGKGTGLGLSTVHGIVRQSGGCISVESELGKGTTFRIYLPREQEAAATLAKEPAAERQSKGNETILLVEDEEELRRVAHRALEAEGYSVLSAADGEEALGISEQYAGDIQLLLTDVVMPRMGGRVLAQKLAKQRPALAVLFISGYTDDAMLYHGVLEAGIHLLGKPFTSTGLTQKVREVLDGGRPTTGRRTKRITGEVAIESEGVKTERTDFAVLPEEILSELRQAAHAARYDEIVEILDEVRLISPGGAEVLRRCVERFDYEGILALVGRENERGGT